MKNTSFKGRQQAGKLLTLATRNSSSKKKADADVNPILPERTLSKQELDMIYTLHEFYFYEMNARLKARQIVPIQLTKNQAKLDELFDAMLIEYGFAVKKPFEHHFADYPDKPTPGQMRALVVGRRYWLLSNVLLVAGPICIAGAITVFMAKHAGFRSFQIVPIWVLALFFVGAVFVTYFAIGLVRKIHPFALRYIVRDEGI